MNAKYITLIIIMLIGALGDVSAQEYYVSPNGSDTNPGSFEKPFKSIVQARDAVRKSNARGKQAITVFLRAGTHYLDDTIVFSPEDSGYLNAPVTYAAYKNEQVIISGGKQLSLDWQPYRDGILQAKTPTDLKMDQLFVNNKRQHMARYPNYDPNKLPYNGYAADAFNPERAKNWNDPVGGFIHAMHKSNWGGYHYEITGKNDDHSVSYEGGWQNNRQMGMNKLYRFVEHIFEELDAPGEWFHDVKTGTLYFYPPQGVDVKTATFEVAQLKHLIEFNGTQQNPVHHVNLTELIFRHAVRTFMETKEPLLRSDWAIYRGGAVFLTGTEDCVIADCEFDQVGGNAIFVNNFNRRVHIRGTYIHDAGASAISFVGSKDAVRSPLFEYHQRQPYEKIDKTPGPKSDDYPGDCVVDDCLIHDIGVVEKQVAGVQISMSKGITVRHCSIYDMARAGINVSEGTFGGHVIEFCDVFDTVRETSDHGSFNSWGRDRYWNLIGASDDKLSELAMLDVEKIIIRNSRWRCDHGWDVDLDDGSSHYEIYNNVFLSGGLKLREGFHRTVYNNIAISGGLHMHVWYKNSNDVVKNNIWMHSYQLTKCQGYGKEIDYNLFGFKMNPKKPSENKVIDVNSIYGDPLFIDPANGDYRVKEGSPAFTIGFKNFPMDQFGVQKPQLKKIARVPKLPNVKGYESKVPTAPSKRETWLGASVVALSGEEFSAFGVSKEDGGIHLVAVPTKSAAAKAGFKDGDLIQSINGHATKTVADLISETKKYGDKPLHINTVRNQKEHIVTVNP